MPVHAPSMTRPLLKAVPHWSKLSREDEVLLFRHMVHAKDGVTVNRVPGATRLS